MAGRRRRERDRTIRTQDALASDAAAGSAVRTIRLEVAETSTSRVSQRCLRMVSRAAIFTRAIANDITMKTGTMVRMWLGRRSRWGSIFAERLTSHQSPSSCTTCQWRAATAMAMKAGATSKVKELAALSSMEKARNRWRRQSQRLPRARRSLRQVLRDQRSCCRKKVRPSRGKVDQTLAERCSTVRWPPSSTRVVSLLSSPDMQGTPRKVSFMNRSEWRSSSDRR